MESTKEALFTASERKTLEALARQRGFESLRGYLMTLLEKDAEQHGEAATVAEEEDNDELFDPVESFRQAWAQAQRGELLTEEEFWKAVAEDD